MTIAKALIDALGGHLNIVEIEPCTMRIRVQVKTQRAVDEAALRVDGVLAVVRSGDVVQIVCGATSDDIAQAMIAPSNPWPMTRLWRLCHSGLTPRILNISSPQRRELDPWIFIPPHPTISTSCAVSPMLTASQPAFGTGTGTGWVSAPQPFSRFSAPSAFPSTNRPRWETSTMRCN